jgi:hypothetical protein
MLVGLRPAAIVAGLVATLWPARAAADLKVHWDCYLPGASVDCALLEGSLTSKIPFVRIVRDPREADVHVTLSSLPAENATRFDFHVLGKQIDGYATEVRAQDKIPWSIDATTATVRVLTKLERALANFMDQKVAAEMKDGELTLALVDPITLPFTGRPEQSGVKWYLSPAVGSYFSDVQGVGINASGSAALSFNYSLTTWRLQQSIGANYLRQSQPVPGTNETASVSFTGGNALNVVSLALTPDNRVNLGLLVAGEKNPQANYTFRTNGSAGLEYDLIPRQTVNQKNLGFRCAMGGEFQRYDATNIQGKDQQVIARELCDVFLSWHFEPVDVWAYVGETAVLEDLDFRSFSAGASATWRLTDDLTISPWFNVQQVNQAIDQAQASNVVYTDPKLEIQASLLAAAQQGYTAPFGIQAGLTIRYLFGNGSLASEDQRWKNATNLR